VGHNTKVLAAEQRRSAGRVCDHCCMAPISVSPDPESDQRSPLLDLLALESLGDDRYRTAAWPSAGSHLFGGQVIGQALRAATSTVHTRYALQSLHSYFVQAGHGASPLDLRVERVRDGRSFAFRQVVATQGERTILILDCSFHEPEPGGEYQVAPNPDVPGPDDEHDWGPRVAPAHFPEMFEQRDFRPEGQDADGVFGSTRRFWIRARHQLPDDAPLHAVILALVSDCGALIAAEPPVGVYGHTGLRTSLDHCVWFHRRTRLDEWVLVDYRPVSNAGARGLVIGSIHTRSGELVATAVQEALTRP
jgi:acyl-CoA thioesterase II